MFKPTTEAQQSIYSDYQMIDPWLPSYYPPRQERK